MSADTVTIYCDGLCEPTNPGGFGCWAYIVYHRGREIRRGCGTLGQEPRMTSNRAEYEAVLRALRWLAHHQKHLQAHGLAPLIHTDSHLVVRQLEGVYAVRSTHLVPLHAEAVELARRVGARIEWVPREQNEAADALSREVYRQAIGRGSSEELEAA